MPAAYVHRIDGHIVARPRHWEIPAFVKLMIGIWPASLTAVVVTAVCSCLW